MQNAPTINCTATWSNTWPVCATAELQVLWTTSMQSTEYRIQNAGSRPNNTLQCTATWSNTWFVMTDQVLLQESAAAELQYVCYGQRLQSREHTEYRTYRIQNTEVQHLYWSLVASHCSCVIAGAVPSILVLLLR